MDTIFKIAVCLYVAFCWQFAYHYMKEEDADLEDADLDLKTPIPIPIPTSIEILEVFIALVSGWCAVPFILGKYLAVVTYDRLHPKYEDSNK